MAPRLDNFCLNLRINECHCFSMFPQPLTHVFGRNIAQVVLKGQTKPLLLSLALQDYSPAMLRAIQTTLRDYVIEG